MSLLTSQKISEYQFVGSPEFLSESGVLVVDKPGGISSMDVIRILKRIIRAKKIGHGGTLDPLATGVLPILINQATRSAGNIMGGVKEYEGSFLLGMCCDTQDVTGKMTSPIQDVPFDLDLEQIRKNAKKLEGEIFQRPPLFSAIKKNGRPLYDYARSGETVVVDQRPVVVEKMEIVDWDGDRRVWFRARVHKGVYVRTLVHDLGQQLGIGAVLESLRRTQAGAYSLEEAVQLSTLKVLSDIKEHLKPIKRNEGTTYDLTRSKN